MKQLLTYLFSVLFFCCIFIGCSDEQTPTAISEESNITSNNALLKTTPSDGDGNKLVFDWDETYSINCNSGDLTVHEAGWAQIRWFGPTNNPNIELGVFHDVYTFTNSDGDEFVYRDVGPDRYFYVEGDKMFVSVSGTSSYSGTPDRDEINIGHMVLNLETNEVELIAGRGLGNLFDLACETLD